LGATERGILGLVLARSLVLSVSGIAIGLAGALVLTRFLRSLVFGIEVTDPLTFTVMSSLLMLVALAASYLPARRAARVDPLVALRSE
jgi:ABC-type antimicrobial peptide transport system permease subunit